MIGCAINYKETKCFDNLFDMLMYDDKYAIEKIRLIDCYNAKDEKSILDNNFSFFIFRYEWGGSWKDPYSPIDQMHFAKFSRFSQKPSQNM